jgi:hypothetical protein
MKKLLTTWIALLALIAATAVQAAPEVTRAVVSPERVQAGESVIFAAQVIDTDDVDPGSLRVGVFFRTGHGEREVLPLRYLEEYDAYMNTLDIPNRVPNGVYTFWVIAMNAEGERSEPVPLDLTVFSTIDVRAVAPRAALLSDEIAAVKNFHRRDGEPGEDTDGIREIEIPLLTSVKFHSTYEGVWYDGSSGWAGTELELYLADPAGEWRLIDSDGRISMELEGPAIRHGQEVVTFPALRPGTYTLKLAVATAAQPSAGDRVTDLDELVFQVTVIE